MIGKKEELYISPIPISYPLKPVSQKSQFVLSKNLHQRLWTKGISLTLMKFKDLGINFFSYLFHCDLTTFFICYYLSISFKKKKKCPCMHTQLCLTLQPHRLQPARLLCLWDFPGKITGVVVMPFSRDLPDPGIRRLSPASPASQVDSLPLGYQGSLSWAYLVFITFFHYFLVFNFLIWSKVLLILHLLMSIFAPLAVKSMVS